MSLNKTSFIMGDYSINNVIYPWRFEFDFKGERKSYGYIHRINIGSFEKYSPEFTLIKDSNLLISYIENQTNNENCNEIRLTNILVMTDFIYEHKRINKNIFFDHVMFVGNVSFKGTVFLCKASFEYATFFKAADFRDCVFEAICSFRSANFMSFARFRRSRFNDIAKFFSTNIQFAYFESVRFYKEFDLKQAKINRLYMRSVINYGIVDLQRLDVKKISFFSLRNLGKIYIKWDTENSGWKTISKAIKDYSYYDLVLDLYVEKSDRYDDDIMDDIDWINTHNNEKIIVEYSRKELGSAEDQESFVSKKEFYQNKAREMSVLKNAMADLGFYQYEDYAYISLRKYESKSRIEPLKNRWYSPIQRFWKRILELPQIVLFDFVGSYGTKPMKVFLTMIIVILIFAGVHFFLGLEYGGSYIDHMTPITSVANTEQIFIASSHKIDNFPTALYFSAITFLTMGFGDLYPVSSLGKTLAVIEGFIGIFLISYFTVSFVRRMLR